MIGVVIKKLKIIIIIVYVIKNIYINHKKCLINKKYCVIIYKKHFKYNINCMMIL